MPTERTVTIPVNSSGYVLTSYSYPSQYDSNSRCNWRFVSDPDTKIHILFTDISTEPEDYISVSSCYDH